MERSPQRRPDNVLLATEPAPLLLEPGVTRLARRAVQAAISPSGWTRPKRRKAACGSLARGAIQSFSEDGHASDIIAPERTSRADLDYLALCDWHGQVRVNDWTWYSGAPEPDRFKHQTPGQALVVSIAGPGAVPLKRRIENRGPASDGDPWGSSGYIVLGFIYAGGHFSFRHSLFPG